MLFRSISTVSQGLTGTPNISVGVLTATSAVIGSGVTIASSGIRVSGIITASSFRPSSGYYQSPNGTNAFYVFDTSGDVSFQGKIVTNYIRSNTNLNPTVTVSDLDLQFARNVNTSGITTSTGGFVGNLTGTATTATTAGYANTSGISTYATTAGIATYADTAGVSTTATTAGYANTSGISTTSQGLTGTPNITVGIITASSASFSGNVSIAGTLTYDDVTNIDSIGLVTARSGIRINSNGLDVVGVSTFNDVVIPTQLRTRSVAEKTSIINGNTVGIAFSSGGGNVAICTNPTGDITLNVTNIPTDSSFDNHSISVSVIVNQTGTARTCTTVNMNGVSRTIRWAGGSLANAISGVTTSTGFDIFTFTGINTVGSASTTSNYVVLGSVNGGFN